MTKMKKYKPVRSPRFERELKRAEKRGLNIDEVEAIIVRLSNDEQLERKYCDHPLNGDSKGCRECHINPDWLLVYRKDKTKLILYLIHTGTHSDLF